MAQAPQSIDFGTLRLSGFPRPNPCFPPPPRKDNQWTWRGVLVFSVLFAASLALLIALALNAEHWELPGGVVVAMVIAGLLALLVGALGAPLAAYNAWRMHPWRCGEIVPARVTRARRTGGMFEALFHLVIHFVPVVGYFVWLASGAQSAKAAYVRNGIRRECKVVCDDAGPPVGATVWVVLPRLWLPARILRTIAPAPWGERALPPDVADWLDRALAAADTTYTRTGGEYTKRG